MGEVIVVTSGKGGVGKTTTVANLGTALALAGKRTVLVDGDIGLRNLDLVMGLENRIVYHLLDIVQGNCRLSQGYIKDKRLDKLFLIPSAQCGNKQDMTAEQMCHLTERLREEFDYVLIDCPAGIEQGFENAVAGADRAIVVTTPEVSAVRDADRVIGILEAMGLPAPYVLVNRLRKAMVRRGDMMNVADISEILAVPLLGVIPEDEAMIVAANRGEPVAKKVKSKLAREYSALAQKLGGEDDLVPPLKKGFSWKEKFHALYHKPRRA